MHSFFGRAQQGYTCSLGTPVVPFFTFHFRISLRKLSVMGKGYPYVQAVTGNLVVIPHMLSFASLDCPVHQPLVYPDFQEGV